MIWDLTRDGYIDLLQREAIVLVPYADGTFRHGPRKGEIKWSQGPGSQWNYTLDRAVEPGDPKIDEDTAILWLRAAVAPRVLDIRRRLKVEITQHQLTGLHSGYYQVGTKLLVRVTDLYNDGLPEQAMLAFSEFPFGEDEVPSEGHAHRRLCEMTISKFGYYGEQLTIPVYDSNPRKSKPRLVDVSELGI